MKTGGKETVGRRLDKGTDAARFLVGVAGGGRSRVGRVEMRPER